MPKQNYSDLLDLESKLTDELVAILDKYTSGSEIAIVKMINSIFPIGGIICPSPGDLYKRSLTSWTLIKDTYQRKSDKLQGADKTRAKELVEEIEHLHRIISDEDR